MVKDTKFISNARHVIVHNADGTTALRWDSLFANIRISLIGDGAYLIEKGLVLRDKYLVSKTQSVEWTP